MATLISLLFCASAVHAAEVWFVPTDEAQKMFGSVAVDAKKFQGDVRSRGGMALDLVKSKKFVGKKLADVEAEFGKADGFFQAGAPAYYLAANEREIFQLVFIPAKGGDVVEHVKIHRRKGEPLPPPESTASFKKNGKKLNVEVRGDAARAMYDQMNDMEIEKGLRKGESVHCSKLRCTFVVDEDGVIDSK